MPNYTPNLNLYKVNPETDGNLTFNIETMLNENWDKLDADKKAQDDAIAEINRKISEPEYSAPQESTSSVITLPDSAIEAPMQVTVKGQTDGDKFTLPCRLRSVGKNLVNVMGNEITPGSITRESETARKIIQNYTVIAGISYDAYFSNGITLLERDSKQGMVKFKCDVTTGYGIGVKFTVEPNTKYTGQVITSGISLAISFYRKDGSYINWASFSSSFPFTFVTPNDCYFAFIVFYTTVIGTYTVNNIRLAEGSTVMQFEPYTETVAYTPIELRSLPNGATDIYDVATGELIQNTKEYVLQSNDIVAMESYTEVDRVEIKKPYDGSGYNDAYKSLWSTLEGFTEETGGGDQNSIERAWKYRSYMINNSFVAYVPKGTYTNLADAKTKLAGKKLIYQLANPIITKHPPQTLVGHPKGTVIIEPGVVRFYAKPDANGVITRPNTDNTLLDIYAVESVRPIIDGVKGESIMPTSYDTTTLTNTAYDSNTEYEVIYKCRPENTTLPIITESHAINMAAALQATTEQSARTTKQLTDYIAYQNAVNLQFDLRLVALEP